MVAPDVIAISAMSTAFERRGQKSASAMWMTGAASSEEPIRFSRAFDLERTGDDAADLRTLRHFSASASSRQEDGVPETVRDAPTTRRRRSAPARIPPP